MNANQIVRKYRVAVAGMIYLAVLWPLMVFAEGMPPGRRLLLTVLPFYLGPVLLTAVWVVEPGRVRRRTAIAVLGMIAWGGFMWLNNTSRFTQPSAPAYLIAHQGVHPPMNPEHDSWVRCLSRIHPPVHSYIGNTLPSIRKAFDSGARIVEVDIVPTADMHFAVFHDDTLDCKTEATGKVADRTMAELRVLDVGYGYYTDAGTFPLRGMGVGMMKSLDDILDAFPEQELLIDVKVGGAYYLDMLSAFLATRTENDRARLVIHTQDQAFANRHPELRIASREAAFKCIRSYLLVGWTGYVPRSCVGSVTGVYLEHAWILWGWPAKFSERMAAANTIVILRSRLPEAQFAASIPAGYFGGIQTDRIEVFRRWMAGYPAALQ